MPQPGLRPCPNPKRRVVEVRQGLLRKNDELAALNRTRFRAQGVWVLNLLSSPGSGKTELLERTLTQLRSRGLRAVIVGDLATDNDARRLRRAGVPVVQITTGNVCHLDAVMVDRAASELHLDGMDLLVIENVGNLVCPASFDLGEDLRAVLLSVTEGEDKPLKYPKIFKTADIVVVSKTDLAGPAGFDRAAALENIHGVAPQAIVLETSARTGEGLEAWCDYLRNGRSASCSNPDEAAPERLASVDAPAALAATRVRVRGVVQGVGFRPFVYRLAREWGLTGWVRNDAEGVSIHVEGEPHRLARFQALLRRAAPGRGDGAFRNRAPQPPQRGSTPSASFPVRALRRGQETVREERRACRRIGPCVLRVCGKSWTCATAAAAMG